MRRSCKTNWRETEIHQIRLQFLSNWSTFRTENAWGGICACDYWDWGTSVDFTNCTITPHNISNKRKLILKMIKTTLRLKIFQLIKSKTALEKLKKRRLNWREQKKVLKDNKKEKWMLYFRVFISALTNKLELLHPCSWLLLLENHPRLQREHRIIGDLHRGTQNTVLRPGTLVTLQIAGHGWRTAWGGGSLSSLTPAELPSLSKLSNSYKIMMN